MPDLSPRFHLCVTQLTTEWQPYHAHIACRVIEMTADKSWRWCTNTGNPEAARTIPAFQREVVVEFTNAVPKGAALFYFKAEEDQGTIWDKCVR